MSKTHDTHRSGLFNAVAAYLIWGFLPLYLALVQNVPPVEFVGWRIIWTLPLCFIFVAFRGQGADVRAAVANPRVIGWLCLSAMLVGGNWLVYVWAIQKGEIYAASLGYYINPLINVLLGTLVLGERLNWRQWLAVAIATVGVFLLLGGALTTLWISLTLALSFGVYGLVRKQVPVGSLPGLTVESMLLFLPAVGVVWFYAQSSAGTSFGHDAGLSVAIAMGGVLTAVPLLLFAVAARKLPYSTLGFIQFLAPTIVFILGLTVFDQPLKPVQLACFACIWTAAAIFIWDMLSRPKEPAAS